MPYTQFPKNNLSWDKIGRAHGYLHSIEKYEYFLYGIHGGAALLGGILKELQFSIQSGVHLSQCKPWYAHLVEGFIEVVIEW